MTDTRWNSTDAILDVLARILRRRPVCRHEDSDSHSDRVRQKGNQMTIAVPVGLLKQHAWLRDSAGWVARISRAMDQKARREPDRGTAQDAHIRIRLYALNGIGERLQILLSIVERGNERVQTAIVRQLVEFVALGAYREALKPQARANKYVFVKHDTNKVVKTYGDKFVALGLANLIDRTLTQETRVQVATVYSDTSAYIHPSALEDRSNRVRGIQELERQAVDT